jgi:hypothetical protein
MPLYFSVGRPELLSDSLLDFLLLCARCEIASVRFSSYAVEVSSDPHKSTPQERLTYYKLQHQHELANSQLLHSLYRLTLSEARAAEVECRRMHYNRSEHLVRDHAQKLYEIESLEAASRLPPLPEENGGTPSSCECDNKVD